MPPVTSTVLGRTRNAYCNGRGRPTVAKPADLVLPPGTTGYQQHNGQKCVCTDCDEGYTGTTCATKMEGAYKGGTDKAAKAKVVSTKGKAKGKEKGTETEDVTVPIVVGKKGGKSTVHENKHHAHDEF